MTWDELVEAVEHWAEARQIIPNSTPEAQLLKCMSELGELADARLKHDVVEVADGIGDVLVTLILFARLSDLNIRGCLESAYDTIKARKGTLMPNGVFVKEETHA